MGGGQRTGQPYLALDALLAIAVSRIYLGNFDDKKSARRLSGFPHFDSSTKAPSRRLAAETELL